MLLLLIGFLRPLTFREMILDICLFDITFQKKKKKQTKILQCKIGFLEKDTETKNSKHSTQNIQVRIGY